MQVNTDVQEASAPGIQIDWEQIQRWSKTVLTRERIIEAVVAFVNVSVIGTIIFSLSKAVQFSAYTGLGYTAFGNF